MSRPIHSGAARWRTERRPSETDSLLVDAHAHLERGHRDRARRVVKETLLTEMSLPEGLEVGRLLNLLDETQAAVDLFHTLLRQARHAVDQATVRAALLMVLERYDEAVEPLRFLVDHRPDAAEAHLRLAQCFLRSGRDAPALAAVRRARQVAPDWPDMHLELGRIALRLGEFEDARVALYRAWRIDPDDRRSTLAIAALWMRARKPAEALPLYEHALETHGDSAQVLVEAGLAYARSERVDDARGCLERLEARHPRRRDAARRLSAAIDEAIALEDSIVELDEDDLVSVDGSLPAGFESLVPVPGKERRLGDVTTGEVEAALGTLDLDISMDDFGSYESYDEPGPIPPPLDAVPSTGPIPPPLGPSAAEEPADESADESAEKPAAEPPAAEQRAHAPSGPAPRRAPVAPADDEDDTPTFERFPLAPPPAAVPPPPLDPGDSVERAFAELVFDDGGVELSPPVRLGADAPIEPTAEPAEPPAAALLAPPVDPDPSSDDMPRLQADIPAAATASVDLEDSFDDESEALSSPGGARAPAPAFALLGPPPAKRRQTGPLPLDNPLPPLMAFGSLSGDLSVANLDEPDPPFESPTQALPPRRRSRRSTGSLPLLAPRPSSAPPARPPEARRRRSSAPPPSNHPGASSLGGPPSSVPPSSMPPSHGPSGSVGGSVGGSAAGSVGGSMGDRGVGRSRRSRHPSGAHRRFDAPPGSGPTGPLPSLPQRQPFAEMTVGQGLTHRGEPGSTPGGSGRSRRGDRARPRTSPGGPMPTPQAGAWGAAPRTDPLLTTSDALQRWRPPTAEKAAEPTPPPEPAASRDGAPGQRLGGRASPSLRSQTALIAGSHAVFWLPRVLRFMEGGHLSGAVGLNAPQGQAEVQFRAGRLTGASASNRPTLAQVLQHPQRLSPNQRGALGDLTWGAQDGESLLDRLVETGLFEAPNVNATVIDQVFATVSEVLRWGVGWFTMVAHADPPSRTGRTVKLPLAALLSGVEDDREGASAAAGLRPPPEAAGLDARLETRIRAQRQRVEREPDDDRARLQLGQLLMRAEHYVQAIDVFMTGLSGSIDQRYVKLIGLAIEGLAQHGPRRGADRLLRIVLCGRLGRVGLVQLLELLGPERVTGTVRLIAHEGLAEIELVDGELAGATNANTARLGDLMRASSIMTSEQIEALVARQYARDPWLPLGRLAVEAGLLEPDQMRGLLQKQVRLALLEAGRWRQAHFVVELGQNTGLKLHRDLDTHGILRDLRRMVGRGR